MISTKHAFLAGWLFLVSAGWGTTAPLMESVPIKLGPKAFRDGDVIQILEVEATSPALEQGDTVTVKGRYRLDSEPSAMLSLFLTRTEGDGREEIDPGQSVDAVAGWHEFEVRILIKHRGFLHLSFHDKSTGAGFGGVYFGTVDQVEEMDKATLFSRADSGGEGRKEMPRGADPGGGPVKALKLKYDYGFSPEVDALMHSVEESDPNQERHPRVKGDVLFERTEVPEEVPNPELLPRRPQKTP